MGLTQHLPLPDLRALLVTVHSDGPGSFLLPPLTLCGSIFQSFEKYLLRFSFKSRNTYSLSGREKSRAEKILSFFPGILSGKS